MNLDGKITISTPIGTDCDYVNIRIIDRNSGIEFVECRVKYADFTQSLVGSRETGCRFHLRGTSNVGKMREDKRENVLVPGGENSIADRQKRATQAVGEHNVDGWVGYTDDAPNHHRVTGHTKDGTWHSVSFCRYVDKET